MIWTKIRRHTDQVEMFRRAATRNRLAHAYLFLGPHGIGKRLFARSLAWCLFCERFDDSELEACGECSNCRLMAADTHPDYLAIGCPEGKSELPIELIRGPKEKKGREGLCHDLSLKPMASDRRIAVIDDVDLLNVASGNALLKTLEEPSPRSILVLIATNEDRVLTTIRSRCQQIRFGPLDQSDVRDLLVESGKAETLEEAESIAGLSDGSLTTADQLLSPELRSIRESLIDTLASGHFDPLTITSESTDAIDALGGNSEQQRRHARWLVRFVVEFYRQVIRALATSSPVAESDAVSRFIARLATTPPGSTEAVMELLERAAETDQQIARRSPVPICLEGLFDDLARRQRACTGI